MTDPIRHGMDEPAGRDDVPGDEEIRGSADEGDEEFEDVEDLEEEDEGE